MLSNSCYLITYGYNSLLANVINHISSPFMLSPYLTITAAVNLFFTKLLKFRLYIFVGGIPWKFRAYFMWLIQLFKRENQAVRRAKSCLTGLPGTRAVRRGCHSPAAYQPRQRGACCWGDARSAPRSSPSPHFVPPGGEAARHQEAAGTVCAPAAPQARRVQPIAAI